MSKINKNLSVILISILGIFIVISIFGYNYWKDKKEIKLEEGEGAQGEITKEGKEKDEEKKIEESQETKSSKENDAKKVKDTEEKTKNWQVYKNTFYNYTLKYPKDWYGGPDNQEDSWIVYFFNQEVEKVTEIDLVEGIKVEILVQGNPRKLSLDDWSKEGHIFGGEPKSSNKIKVGGYDAIKEESDYEGQAITIYFFKGDSVYTISYSGAEADYNKYKGEFDLMIGSFKFE
ncbi:MAG: hypothetical protein HQ538_00430 [Parcubacteria group bacterium]|nr:hypothetical protein [Parcubacteria group bacterium]